MANPEYVAGSHSGHEVPQQLVEDPSLTTVAQSLHTPSRDQKVDHPVNNPAYAGMHTSLAYLLCEGSLDRCGGKGDWPV